MADREIDNTYQRKIYKDKKFDGKRTMKDEYTGETIHYGNKKDAKKRYSTKNIADTDHITPLHVIEEKYPYLTKEEQRIIANKDYNLAITNSALNRSKGDLENHELVIRSLRNQVGNKIPEDVRKQLGIFEDVKENAYDINLKTAVRLMGKEANSQVHMEIDAKATFTIRKVNESAKYLESHNLLGDSFIGKEEMKAAHNSAKEVAMTAAVSSSIHNIYMVAYGEKNPDEAAKNVLQATGSAYLARHVKACCEKQVIKTTERLAGKEAAVFLTEAIPIMSSKINMLLESGEFLYKLVDEQINAEECAAQIGISALGQLAFSAGSVLLPPIGGIFAQLMIEFVCNEIYAQAQAIKQVTKNNNKKVSRINSLVAEALVEIEKSQNQLKLEMQKIYEEWDANTERGFRLVHDAILNNDVEAIALGYSIILTNFNKNVLFSSRDEFDEFMASGEILVF